MHIEADPSTFIDPIYYPQTVTLKDPQNMPMEDIKSFLAHIQAREGAEGAAKAFCFRKYWYKAGLCDASYMPQSLADGSIQAAAGSTVAFNTAGTHSETHKMKPRFCSDTHRKQLRLVAVLNLTAATVVDTNTLINQETMSRLTTLGIPTSIPVNGPDNGQPMYYMPHEGSALMLAGIIDPILQAQPFMGSGTSD
jgi:hypothetical protein